MTITLSKRVSQVKPSATLAISARAAELKAEGKDIISLSVGEPDFDTPQHIKDAAIKAMNEGFTRYTPVPGLPSLRKAIVNKLKVDNQLDYSINQILVSSGAKQSIYNLMQAVLDEGDEVIIPAPYWVSYPDMALLAGAKPVFVEAKHQDKFKITAEGLKAAITNKTKLILLNSPSNPTGMAYSQAELKAIGEVLLQHPNIVIASDDIYEHILWADEPFANILNACPNLYDRTVVINGVSKAYAMTGWRIGYAAGPQELIKAMSKIQSQSSSNACSISQKAAEEALTAKQDDVKEMVKAFKIRHDKAVNLLNNTPGFHCHPADGAFYLFPSVQEAIDKLEGIDNDVAFSEYLLNKAEVATVPGTAFGAPGCIRLSIALSEQSFATAVERISKVLA